MTFRDFFNTKKTLQEKKKRRKKKKTSSKFYRWGYFGYGYPGVYNDVGAAGGGNE